MRGTTLFYPLTIGRLKNHGARRSPNKHRACIVRANDMQHARERKTRAIIG
ncbi:MAG: hypothetical protein BSOLF_1290 [Candidatus Carbobacillus altaicus]|uniref:Uncharacterized protein n=1 Tax=Candidatus Carbonibacillus altaicus TaxID=2163959 RepID=A0A2R6Y4H0_9BACL|nr:MAG: hypothetical protein BSOLF_1290 [Candidatus Carbobacillus altaicus]